MPAAAVIPAPIAYIKVAAVEKLVVGLGEVPSRPGLAASGSAGRGGHNIGPERVASIHLSGAGSRPLRTVLP